MDLCKWGEGSITPSPFAGTGRSAAGAMIPMAKCPTLRLDPASSRPSRAVVPPWPCGPTAPSRLGGTTGPESCRTPRQSRDSSWSALPAAITPWPCAPTAPSPPGAKMTLGKSRALRPAPATWTSGPATTTRSRSSATTRAAPCASATARVRPAPARAPAPPARAAPTPVAWAGPCSRARAAPTSCSTPSGSTSGACRAPSSACA